MYFRIRRTTPRFLFLTDCNMFFHGEEFNQGNSSSLLVPRFYHPLSFPIALSKAKLVLVMSLARCSHLKEKQHASCCKIVTVLGIPADGLNSYFKPSSVPNHRGILQPSDPALTCHTKTEEKKISASLISSSNNLFKRKNFTSYFRKILRDGFHAIPRFLKGYLYHQIDFFSHQIHINFNKLLPL